MYMRTPYCFVSVLFLTVFFSCQREKYALDVSNTPIYLIASDYDIDNNVSVITKTDVTIISDLQTNGFNVTATRGNNGVEYAVWSNVHFGYDTSHSPAVFTGDRWWPGTNPGYHFSASTATMTHTPSGETVTVSNTQDVVCAYLRYPQYRNVNTLTFEHIFARLCNVTVNATDGYTISNVNIQLTPKTGGTYNINQGANLSDRTGWSSFTIGTLTTVSNNAVTITTSNTKSNDIYLVPGTYEVSLAWTATKGEYTQNYSQIYCEVDLSSGKRNNLTFNLNGNAKDIEFIVSIEPWVSDSTSLTANDFSKPPVYTFAGLEIAPGNLYYDGYSWSIDQSWNEHDTSNSYYGVNSGTPSSYFNFAEMGELFQTDNFYSYYLSLNSDEESLEDYFINNDLEPFGSWRLPTRYEWIQILTSNPGVREGSTVNGVSNVHYALIELSDFPYFGSDNPCGILIFPDGESITGELLLGIDDDHTFTSITETQLDVYLNAGCVFLPSCGLFTYEKKSIVFLEGGDFGYYFSSTCNPWGDLYFLFFSDYIDFQDDASHLDLYLSARLIRTAE